MSKPRVDMHRLQDLVRLHRKGVAPTEIVRVLRMSRKTERAYRRALKRAGLLEGAPEDVPPLEVLREAVERALPPKVAPQQESTAGVWRPRIAELVEKGKRPKVIYDVLCREQGKDFVASYDAVYRLVRRILRERGVRPEDVAIPIVVKPGLEAQVDFGYVGKILDPKTGRVRKTWIFVMTLAHSRHMVVRLVFDQSEATWLRCHVEAFEVLGGVPGTIIPDNLKSAVIRRAFGVDEETTLNRSYRELARHYDTMIDPGLVASGFGAVAFWLDSRLPVALIAIGALAGLLKLSGVRRHKVRYPGLAAARLKDYGKTDPSPGLLALDRPITARAGNDKPLAVVCVSGGASRAAAWTAAVLARLEAEIEGFSASTALITGASGGMVGAAYHVAGLRPDEAGCSYEAGRPWRASAQQAIGRLGADNLSHVVHRLVHADLLSALSPWAFADRGQALEEAWSETLAGRLDRTLAELRDGENAGWCPSLVFSPMLVEDGRRLLVSNLDLAAIATNEGPALGSLRDKFCSRSELELRKLFPKDGGDLKLCTAARMSASFPFVSPAATLPTEPRRRVVDAGYYDNYGVNLATIWLDACRDALGDRKVVIVQIRDGPSEDDLAKLHGPTDRSTSLSRGLEWLTSPFQAVLAARNAVMAYRNDEAVEILQRSVPKVTTVVFEAPKDVSMTWYLATEEQNRLLEGLANEEINKRVEALKQWWRAPARRAAISDPLRDLLDAACRSGELILACGQRGASANLVGRLALQRHGEEDRLDVDDGTHHAHMDWELVTRVEVGEVDGEGLLALHSIGDALLKFYRPEGPFPQEVSELAERVNRAAQTPPDLVMEPE